jgi:hypothetical protein
LKRKESKIEVASRKGFEPLTYGLGNLVRPYARLYARGTVVAALAFAPTLATQLASADSRPEQYLGLAFSI